MAGSADGAKMIVESDEDVEVLQAVRECRPAALSVLASFGLDLLPLLHRSKVDREGSPENLDQEDPDIASACDDSEQRGRGLPPQRTQVAGGIELHWFLGQDRIRSRITHRHFAIIRSRSKPNSSNRSAGPVWK